MKYELLPDPVLFSLDGESYTVYKIKAVESFGDVSVGDVGGFVESMENLSQLGCCWLYDNAVSVGGGRVYGNAKAKGNAVIGGNGKLYDCAKANGNAVIKGNAQVYDMARAYENAVIEGDAKIRGLMRVYADNHVVGNNWK